LCSSLALVCSAGRCEATIQACARRWLSCAPQGGVRLQSSFWSRISSLQARVRYGSRPCSRESGLIRERDSCFCHCGLVCHRSSWYIHVNVTQSIVCEWHQFQGLNVQSISPKFSSLRRAKGHRGNLIIPLPERAPPSVRDKWCLPIQTIHSWLCVNPVHEITTNHDDFLNKPQTKPNGQTHRLHVSKSIWRPPRGLTPLLET
jgi:hypothetical protein